jgi:hypothetical protein
MTLLNTCELIEVVAEEPRKKISKKRITADDMRAIMEETRTSQRVKKPVKREGFRDDDEKPARKAKVSFDDEEYGRPAKKKKPKKEK